MVFVVLEAGNLFLKLCKQLLFKKKFQIANMERILIFRTGSIGDIICSFPALYHITRNFPGKKIDILTNAGSANLVSMEKLLDEQYYNKIINYLGKSPTELWRDLRQNKYDLVIQFPQQYAGVFSQLRDMFFFRSAGIKHGFGWQKSSTRIFKRTQEHFCIQKNETEILLDIVRKNRLDVAGESQYPLNISKQDKAMVYTDIEFAGISRERLIGVVIGAKRPQNRWPLHYFKEVVQYLVKNNFQIILIGGKEDVINAEQLAGRNVFNYCGKYTPVQSAAALSACRLVISNDTGPMHLAYASDVPVVAVFSSRDFPGRWYPPVDEKHKIFRNHQVHCSLCLSENCQDNICMKGIMPAEIITYLDKYLLNKK